jgi:predicted polyphosphate/ATP-dependent NAD kinase
VFRRVALITALAATSTATAAARAPLSLSHAANAATTLTSNVAHEIAHSRGISDVLYFITQPGTCTRINGNTVTCHSTILATQAVRGGSRVVEDDIAWHLALRSDGTISHAGKQERYFASGRFHATHRNSLTRYDQGSQGLSIGPYKRVTT